MKTIRFSIVLFILIAILATIQALRLDAGEPKSILVMQLTTIVFQIGALVMIAVLVVNSLKRKDDNDK